MARLTKQEYSEFSQLLEKIRVHRPDIRVGQLICTLAMMVPGHAGRSAWEVDDEELLVAARRHLIQLENRTQTEELSQQDRLELINEAQ